MLSVNKTGLILALDPGGTTGIASKRQSDETGFKFKQLGPDEHHHPLWKYLTMQDPTVVIFEGFDSMPLRDVTINLMAREYIGVAKLYCKSTDKPCIKQQRSAAKGLWTDQKIKLLGLWQPGQKHSMDALRHLLYFLTVQLKDLQWVQQVHQAEQALALPDPEALE